MNLFDLSNPYFSAGFGLVGLGIAGRLLQRSSATVLSLLQKRLITTLEIPINDQTYPWMLEFLSKHERLPFPLSQSPSRIKQFLANIKPPPSHVLSVNSTFTKRENGSSVVDVNLRPGIGVYYIKYNSAWVEVTRSRDTKMIDMKSGAPWETIQMRTLSMDKGVYMQMLNEAKRDALAKEVGKTVIFTSYGHEWRPFGLPRRKRMLESVVLDTGVSARIYKDVKDFLNNGKWYYDRGIPYRRGYLLHGEAGTGKTSFIQALAGELDYNVCILNLAERGLTDDRLAHLLTNAPPRSILLLEDIDAAFTKQRDSKNEMQSALTFSGLLNALDGVASSEERILFMTTNHLDRLDDALIRPGRVDYKQYIGYASDTQIMSMFLRFFPGESALATEFVERVKDVLGERKISTALLQGYFVLHRTVSEAMANTKTIV